MPSAVQDPVRSIRVRPERARPHLRSAMSSGERCRGRTEPGEARPREVDKPYPASDLDSGQGALAELALAHRSQARISAERLDERSVECLGRIQHAELLTRVIEPILQGPSKEHRAVVHAVKPQPRASGLKNG